MADVLHFLASESQAICGEIRIGITVTKDPSKVLQMVSPETKLGIAMEGACQQCANALAVTKLVKPIPPAPVEIIDAPG